MSKIMSRRSIIVLWVSVLALVAGVLPAGAGTLEVLHAFGQSPRPSQPTGRLLFGADGRIYGVTGYGGTNDRGTVYAISPDGTGFEVLLEMGGPGTGRFPTSGLVQASDGTLFGLTQQSEGPHGGTIYWVAHDGSATGISHEFGYDFPTGGAYPGGELSMSADGTVFGAASFGLAPIEGSIYSFDTVGKTFKALYGFEQPSDGGNPGYGPIIGADQRLYGVAAGGSGGGGVVYAVNSNGTGFTILHSFTSDVEDPTSEIVQGSDGWLYGTYGTDFFGYLMRPGKIYRLAPDGSGFEVIHEFDFDRHGYMPSCALTFGPDGRLYGVTRTGGPVGSGGIFALNTNGTGFEIVHYFSESAEGYNALSEVVFGQDGRIYGTTSNGGPEGGGTIFAFTLGGSDAPVVSCPATFERNYGTSFEFFVGATGAPATFSLDGTLPPGVNFDAASGQVYGSATQSGVYPLKFTAANAFGEGVATTELTIAKATANVGIEGTVQNFDGAPKSVTPIVEPAGLATNVTYDGVATPPSAIGYYRTVVTVDDPNYQGTAEEWFAIADPAATPPTIVTQPVSQTVNAGETITLTVEVAGSPPYLYRWSRDWMEFAITREPTITIENIAGNQTGDYRVWVTSPFGGVNTEPAQVVVEVRTENDEFYFTTIAGEPGVTGSSGNSAAKFAEPTAIARSPDGSLVVADRNSHTIRRITPDGFVSTIAGMGGEPGSADGTGVEARFKTPEGIAVDSEGTIWVSDTGNHTIRRIATDGTVSTFAGVAGESGSTDGPSEVVRFKSPTGIVADSFGFLYVADTGNYTVRRIGPDGFTYLLAGIPGEQGNYQSYHGNPRFGLPMGIAVDPLGNVFVVDGRYQNIRKITQGGEVSLLAGSTAAEWNGGYVDGLGDQARFAGARGLCLDTDGNLYVADAGNGMLRKVSPSGNVTTLVGSLPLPGTGNSYRDGDAATAQFGYPVDVEIDPSGNLFVVEAFLFHAVRKVTPDGYVGTFAGQPYYEGSGDSEGVNSLFHFPYSIAVDSGGDLIVADMVNKTIRRVGLDGRSTVIGGLINQGAGYVEELRDIRLDGPYGVAVAPNGEIIIADRGSNTIRKITNDGQLFTLAGGGNNGPQMDGTGSEASFAEPLKVAVDGGGNIFVLDRPYGLIRRVTPEGVVTTPFTGVSAADIVIDGAGNLLVAGGSSNVVRKVTPDGTETIIAGKVYEPGRVDGPAVDARFGDVRGIAVDANGFVYLADTTNSAIRMITPGGVVTTIGGMALSEGSDDGYRTNSRFNLPESIAIDPDGNIFIADTASHTIRMGAHPTAPEFVVQPAEKRAIEGWSVTFEATAGGYPKPNYQWRKEGVDIPGATGPTFTVASVAAEDFGNYSVVATNFAGSAESATARLALPDPPEIMAQPIVKTVVLGGNVTYSVSVSGTPPFTYQWKRNGVAIAGATNATLTLTNVQAGQGGNYSVTVSNVVGSVTSNAAALTIDTTPRLINVSCRGFAGAGDDTLVMGFYITGNTNKTLLIRGVGPKLADFIPGEVVTDPRIAVYRANTLLDGNDNWDAALAPEFARMGGFALEAGSKDAAMTITLAPGGYTVHLVNDGLVAEGLIEVYDLSRDLGSRLTNVSCRLNMKPGQIIILGTALIGSQVSVLARSVGPGLAQYLPEGASVLADPHLRVYSGDNEIAVNDDWEAATGAFFESVGAFGFDAGSKDAAVRVPFTPGGVTVHATGKGGAGIAIIELYESP